MNRNAQIGTIRLLALVLCPTLLWGDVPDIEPWRVELYDAWKKQPIPPITPYKGPFENGDARRFKGTGKDLIELKKKDKEKYGLICDQWWDWKRVHAYNPDNDPREIDLEYEAAAIEYWRMMGYNCAYKGGIWGYRSGRYLKKAGMHGAIDQTLFGANGPPAVNFDGSLSPRQRESCGSFFHPDNVKAGVDMLTNLVKNYGDQDMYKVDGHYITCSWDEVGLRSRKYIDYHPDATVEFRRFLKEVWFMDDAPGRDSNKDGRTYNAFTGEKLQTWDQVEMLKLGPRYANPAWAKGKQIFSKNPEVDKKLFDEPGRFKLLLDFHGYYTIEFFRRVNEAASENLKAMGKTGRVICYPFMQHFLIWPSANCAAGNNNYWYHRLSSIVNIEHCWPDMPAMNLNYAMSDRLAPKFKNTIMGWLWFYPGKEAYGKYDGPNDIARGVARMMGHVIDGSHHWLDSPTYRGQYREQGKQIAYWQNFLANHYQTFLNRSAPPRTQIALLMPDYTGRFYRYFMYPKQDYGWTAEAFQNAQLPFEIITEEELDLETDTLDDYKVLYVIGSEWTTPTIKKRIQAFLAKGGIVHANVDSLTLDITTNERTDFLKQNFGVDIKHKYKNGFYPSTQSAEESVWGLQPLGWGGLLNLQGVTVHRMNTPMGYTRLWKQTKREYVRDPETKKPIRDEHDLLVPHESWVLIRDKDGKVQPDEEAWKELDAHMAAMPRKVRGIEQSPLDMRTPPRVKYPGQDEAVVCWSEVDVAEPVGDAKPIAFYGDKVCGIETKNTVWYGTRPGMSLHALTPRMIMTRTGEPCNPFLSEIPELYESHRPYVEAMAYAARKAGVTRPVTLKRADGQLPMNLEVLPRIDAEGTLMVIVINHDKTEASYQVEVSDRLMKQLAGAEAWNMLDEEVIERNTDGQFEIAVPTWGIAVFMLGKDKALAPVKTAQARLNKKDFSIPKYFLDRPELNQKDW